MVAKKCVKGTECGSACISTLRVCRINRERLKEETKQYNQQLLASLRESYGDQVIDRIETVLDTIKPSWQGLPDKAQTKFTDIDDLYANAEKAQNEFITIMDRGTGLDRTLGGSSAVEDYTKAQRLMERQGVAVIVGRVKSRERALEKAEADYKDKDNPISYLKDIVRGTVAVDSLDEVVTVLPEVVKAMEAKGYKLLQKPKNNYADPTEAGYRDVNMVFVSPDGVPVELQVNTKAMLKAKDVGHKWYETIRTMDAEAAKNDDIITIEDWEKRKMLIDKSRAVYDQAFRDSIAPPKPKPKPNSAPSSKPKPKKLTFEVK